MSVTILDDGKISSQVCYTHYGHNQDLQHIWIPKQTKDGIAAKLQQGISRERILNDIRNNMTVSNFKRHHLIDKKDINNIEKSYGLKAIHRHANDQTSVLSWISEWNDNP